VKTLKNPTFHLLPLRFIAQVFGNAQFLGNTSKTTFNHEGTKGAKNGEIQNQSEKILKPILRLGLLGALVSWWLNFGCMF
jgi:hypothetical protein